MKPAAKQGVQPPRLPKSLQAEVIESLADDGEYAAVSISGCNLAGQAAANVHFEQVHLRRTAFNQTQLPRLRMLDVRIEDSDFSGAVWEQAQLQRVEFIGCRLLGMQLFAARLQNILFQACTFEDAQLATAVCRAVRFEKCTLRNASFELADLAGGVFHQCDLTNADLRGTQLQGTDFRGSVLNAVQVEAKDLQGAVIDAAQALQIVGFLGVTVRASDE